MHTSGGSDDKDPACSAGDPGAVPGWGRSPGAGNENPLQYSCLEGPMDRGTWRATVHFSGAWLCMTANIHTLLKRMPASIPRTLLSSQTGILDSSAHPQSPNTHCWASVGLGAAYDRDYLTFVPL